MPLWRTAWTTGNRASSLFASAHLFPQPNPIRMDTATLTDTESFIEAQFPVSKVSKESYKERKANRSQTLNGLGKWWGRKPLVMIRAALIGLLMPPSDDPKRDREIFLKIMTMDEDGLKTEREEIPKPGVIIVLSRGKAGRLFRSLCTFRKGLAGATSSIAPCRYG